MLDHLTQTEQEQQEEQKQSDPESISSNEVFFKQLFEMFDADKLGFISVDNVVNKFKQDIADPANSEDVRVFTNCLDPRHSHMNIIFFCLENEFQFKSIGKFT
jgi:hypothetical protein